MYAYKQQVFSPTRSRDMLEDMWDSSNVAENAFFQSDPNTLTMTKYLDLLKDILKI